MSIIDSMTLRQKAAQLIVAGFPGQAAGAELVELVQTHQIGGLILFRRNIKDIASLTSLTAEIRLLGAASPLPLFVGVDEEGGTVSRLPTDLISLPDALVMGAIDDLGLTYWTAAALARELRFVGINVNFAPVLDVHQPGADFMRRRSYGSDPQPVAAHGIAFAQGMAEGGVLAVGKHFPGHGATPVDSHFSLPVIGADLPTVQTRELKPFAAAIKAGIPAIMIGHLAFPALDGTCLPATRSASVMTELLRNEMGFTGLVVTDDLEMKAYALDTQWEQAIVETVAGGADILLICHSLELQLRAIEAIVDAVLCGLLCEYELDKKVLRIAQAKVRLIPGPAQLSPAELEAYLAGDEVRAVRRELVTRAARIAVLARP